MLEQPLSLYSLCCTEDGLCCMPHQLQGPPEWASLAKLQLAYQLIRVSVSSPPIQETFRSLPASPGHLPRVLASHIWQSVMQAWLLSA